MDQIRHFKTDELTRNRFVEMVVESYKAQNTSTSSDAYHETSEAVIYEDAQANHVNNETFNTADDQNGQQSTVTTQTDEQLDEWRTALADLETAIADVKATSTESEFKQFQAKVIDELHQIVNDCQQSAGFRQNVLPELHVRLRDKSNEIQQTVTSEPITQHFNRSETIRHRSARRRRPRPVSINIRSALANYGDLNTAIESLLE